MNQSFRICLGLGLCIASSLNSFAGYIYDLQAPIWRGQTNTTYQAWGFETPNSVNVAPTLVNNIYGSPLANITLGPFASGYLPSLPGLGSQTNYWDLGQAGSIVLSIPHVAGLSSTIALQITYFQSITQPPTISINNSYGAATLLTSSTVTVETVPALGAWLTTSSTWSLSPAADITDYYWIIGGGNGSVVESVVVDTKTVIPEPTVFSLLGAAMAMIVFRRNSRRA
jgi:hypothetical protein